MVKKDAEFEHLVLSQMDKGVADHDYAQFLKNFNISILKDKFSSTTSLIEIPTDRLKELAKIQMIFFEFTNDSIKHNMFSRWLMFMEEERLLEEENSTLKEEKQAYLLLKSMFKLH